MAFKAKNGIDVNSGKFTVDSSGVVNAKKVIELVNVKAFGAVGNNRADDTAAIAEASEYCLANGGILFFPKGEYYYQDYTIPDYITVFYEDGRIIQSGRAYFKLGTRQPLTDVKEGTMYYDTNKNSIRVYDGTNWYYVRTFSDCVTPLEFGAVGDGAADDTDALVAAINYCSIPPAGGRYVKLLLPLNKVFRITETVNFKLARKIESLGGILIDHNDVGIIIGDIYSSTVPNYSDLFFKSVTRVTGRSTTNPDIRISGLSSSRVTIQYCEYVQLHSGSYVNSIKDCEFHFSKVDKLEIDNNNSSYSIDDNTFWGGTFESIDIKGDYSHKNNIWYNPVLNAGHLNIENGNSNAFYNAVFIGNPVVSFSPGTYNNVITEHSLADQINQVDSEVSAEITDLGANYILKDVDLLKDTKNLVLISTKNKFFNKSSNIKGVTNIEGGINLLKAEINNTVYQSDFIPVKAGTSLTCKSDVVMWKFNLTCYDSNKDIIIQDTPPLVCSSGTEYGLANGITSQRVNTGSASFLITDNNVEYIKLEIRVGTQTNYFGYVSASLQFKKFSNSSEIFLNEQEFKIPNSNSEPSTGFGEIGDIVIRPAGGYWSCVKSLKLNSNSVTNFPIESNTITLNTENIEAGDVIGIDLRNGRTHWTKVVSKTLTSVTIQNALPSVAYGGDSVVINKWVKIGDPNESFLTDSNQVKWKVTVDTTGALTTTRV